MRIRTGVLSFLNDFFRGNLRTVHHSGIKLRDGYAPMDMTPEITDEPVGLIRASRRCNLRDIVIAPL